MKEKVLFENSKGDKISGILSNPSSDTERPVIVICHGFGRDKESKTPISFEKSLNDEDIATLRFDFFGSGESEGDFEDMTISEAIDDVMNAISFLKRSGYRRIGLLGSSFGGLASLIAASESDDIFVLALKCPVSNHLGKLIAENSGCDIESWRENGFIDYERSSDGRKFRLRYSFFEDSEKNNGHEAARKIRVPTIIVHGDSDETVPVEQSRKTAEMIENCTLEVIPGADHRFSSNPRDFKKVTELITNFLAQKSVK